MSIYTMERVLWDLHADPVKVARFHSNASEFLSAYPLSGEERVLLESMDVRTIADMGVSQMLLFCSWQAIHGGPPSVPEYMSRMNTR
ncbi:hypothetical protein [Burkholderia sp. lig30]|uniref:hypothetical protein n=1 Tax=Burkholderia sp. lig30 TaxID=1192124 RepID=UPI0005725723|nr:hypothetical protein [Burkholderia sp. lig30]